ncbi:MAG: tyrosine-type recombinase/integrase [Gemmatimonadales bacterium]
MAYTRAGRPTFYFQARTQHGWRLMSTRTPDRALAKKIEAMWEALATEHRAWDCLEPVLQRQMTIGALFDAWRDAGRNVEELRRRLNDVDVEPLIAGFLAVHKAKVKPDSLEHIEFHLRALIPEGQPLPRSKATVEYLTTQLYGYTGKPGTLRKVHSDWSVFFAYLADVRGLYERNPMERVTRPPATKPIVRFYELDVVERIVASQPTLERRALFALLYGTAIEISVALKLTRADVLEQRKEVRGAGTKTHTRDRVTRVADWAWPIVWELAKAKLPAARLFDGVPSRYTASDWHVAAVGPEGLDLAEQLPMKNARHHWAVRQLRAGAPIKLVQEQLGHASPNLTLNTYGQFRPSGADRDRWEEAATEYEKTRREATPAGDSNDDSSADSSANNPQPLNHSRGGT